MAGVCVMKKAATVKTFTFLLRTEDIFTFLLRREDVQRLLVSVCMLILGVQAAKKNCTFMPCCWTDMIRSTNTW